MDFTINGKETEIFTGISSWNLRFHENHGLITPLINPNNDYREYNNEDIEWLKIIRSFRTIDVPLDIIKY